MNTDLKPDDITKISLDSLKFTFEQGEKRLKESLDSGTALIARAYNVLTLSLGVFIAIATFLVSSFNKGESLNTIHIIALIAAILLFLIVCELVSKIKPITYRGIGAHPEYLFQKQWLVSTDETKEGLELKMKLLYCSEIQECGDKIDASIDSNKKISSSLKITINTLLFLPAGMTFVFFLILLFDVI